jgi:hypothetical protein
MKKSISIILFLLICATCLSAQTESRELNSDPEKARLVTSDIENFWRAFDLAEKETGAEAKTAVFEREYFEKGSPGLKDFTQLRIKSAKNLVATIDARPGYYASIRQSTLRVAEMEKQIRQSFKELKKLYPEAVFPDVYFMVGAMNSGGTVSKNGLLIGTEMYGLTPAAPRTELNDWLKANLKAIDALPYIVAHELIHFQQKYPVNPTLLKQAVAEGSADFLGEKISGKHINPVAHAYGSENEKTLWQEFHPIMHEGNRFRDWFGAGEKNRPSDLGYYIGYKISEAYYKNAGDKREAIREILTVQDFAGFLEKSKYAEIMQN